MRVCVCVYMFTLVSLHREWFEVLLMQTMIENYTVIRYTYLSNLLNICVYTE